VPVPGIYPINVLAIVIWQQDFFMPQEPRVSRALLALIEKERCGEQVDTHLLAGVVSGYVNLGAADSAVAGIDKSLFVYRAHLEQPLLAATTAFYAAESSEFIALNPIADYMRKIETRLAEERQRARQYLHLSTEEALIAATEQAMVGAHVEALWAAFAPLLAADKRDDLARMYRLLQHRAPERGLQPLLAPFSEHAQASGHAAVEELAAKDGVPEPAEYVSTLVRSYEHHKSLVTSAFQRNAQFSEGLDKAARRYVNENAVTKAANSSSKSPELIARYTDQLLRKSAKFDAVEVEGALANVMSIFVFVDDQDVFQTFYAKLLAKRLIHGTSASEDLEGQMLGRLKAACGHEFTQKLQCMFTDVAGSRELMDAFRAKHKPAQLPPVDFAVMVLATNSWPLQAAATNFSMPDLLQQCEALFTKFYVKTYSGRKLNWLHQLAKADVRTHYTTTNKAGYTFQCSTYQLGVLLLFNELPDNAELTAEQIQTATLLNDAAMRTALLSLVKTTVLLMNPKPTGGGAVNKTHKFKLNLAFKSKKMRVLINVPVPQEKADESAATHQTIADDRKLIVQAAIVRVLKMRKRLAHANLISEVVAQLTTFKPKIAVIKRCIDQLIEKEYLERVEGDNYQYLA
jgi:cullin 1